MMRSIRLIVALFVALTFLQTDGRSISNLTSSAEIAAKQQLLCNQSSVGYEL